MRHIDYHGPAGLYLGRDRQSAAAQGPRTFSTAAKAIRFAIEEAAPVSLRGAWLETGGTTFFGDEFARLYGGRDYPLSRRGAADESSPRLRSASKEPDMQKFNYEASAELYPSRRYAKTQQARYRRFGRAADAIRYIVEDLPAKWLAGSHLEVDEQRFEGAAIRELYDASDYPLRRALIAA